MSHIGSLFRPYSKLVQIEVVGQLFEVPENNPLLRALQYVIAEKIACGRFCWNQSCEHCQISYDMGEGTPTQTALGCVLIVEEGMRVTELSSELRYCLRDVKKNQIVRDIQRKTDTTV